MKGFLDYLPGKSVLHKMHPLVKIFVSILICAASFCSSNYFFLLGIILINILLGAIGNGKEHNGLLSRTFGILKGLVKMSIFLFILQLIVIRKGEPLLTFGSFFNYRHCSSKSSSACSQTYWGYSSSFYFDFCNKS